MKISKKYCHGIQGEDAPIYINPKVEKEVRVLIKELDKLHSHSGKKEKK